MKHLRLLLCLTVVAMFSTATVAMADSYDSETATVQKGGASTAKIMVGKDTFTTPITFEDGASWDTVKDHYEMNPAAVEGLKAGTMMISAGADGTLTYKPCACKKSSSKKK
jgi:hypothetical protein